MLVKSEIMDSSFDNLSEGDLSDNALEIVLESPKRKLPRKSRTPRKLERSELEIIDSIAKDLDEILDAKAAKSNLTTINVKSILKQVVTNEHVLGLVRQSEDPQASTKLPFEPKLTRAKAKELFPSPPVAALPWQSPKRPSIEVQKLIAEELAEDSSGDEYVPMEEESEDDREGSFTSEPRSVSPLTPIKEPESEQIQWTNDGIFKIPPARSQEVEVEEANIARRTRSKLCLTSTPLETIEEAFIPPDITTDMYDMDCDNDDWRDFLKKFTRPLDEVTKPSEDEEHDPEYNILADEEVDEVDKEELRADRAVKVSRKEFNDMLAELFEYGDHFEDNDENNVTGTTTNESQLMSDISDVVDSSSNLNVTPIDAPIPNIEPSSELLYCEIIRMDQKLLLEQQLRQHVQLLTQHFILSYQHPEYHDISSEFKSCLYNYTCLAELIENSIFKTCNLEAAIKLINDWEAQFELNTDEIKEMKAYVCRVLHESQINRAAGIEYVVTFPPLIIETISKSDVFIYPELLPIIPFKSLSLFSKFLEDYTTSENQLVAIGLEKFIPDLAHKQSNFNNKGTVKLTKVCALIQKYLIPTKQITRLYNHIHHSKHPRSPGNPIKYYFQNGRAPVVIHYVRNLEEFGILSPCRRKKELLPYQWKMYLYPNASQENNNTTPAVTSPTTITKIQRPPAYNKNFTNKKLRRRTVNSNTRNITEQSTPRPRQSELAAPFCSTPKVTSICTRKQLDQYFQSPKVFKIVINPTLRTFKFNSSIFKKLKKPNRGHRNMLPSMPFLDGSTGDNLLTNHSAQLTHIDSEMEIINVECEDDEEVAHKDNEDDINALMVASSTIRTTNRRSQSSTDKKRARLQREYLANLAMLSPEDPAYLQEKAQSYAQAYFDKIKERLSTDDYNEFMELLNNFEEKTCNITELYKHIERILGSKHADLKEEFLTFLMPSQAREIGKLIPFYMLSNMSLFLRKLELYFKDQPAQLRKIYRSLTYLTTCVDINMERVKTTILPLLKGNSLLTDWFLQIFPCERPPPSLLNGVWERIETRPEFNLHEDVFETVTIPEMEDQYGGHNCICECHENGDATLKSGGQHCIQCGVKFLQGRVYIQTPKGLRLANVTFSGNSGIDHNLRLNGVSNDRRKRRSEVSPSKQFTSPTKDGHEDHRISLDSEDDAEGSKRKARLSRSPRKKRVKFRDTNEKVAYTEPVEVPSENIVPLTVENNIPSGPEIVDPVPSLVTCDTLNQNPIEDNAEWDCNTSIESIEVRHSPEHSAESESECCEESSQDNINTETDESAEELESLTNSPVHSENSNSNHAHEDILWTRDEDKIILETLQKEGGKDSAFVSISELLESRSVLQIKERVQTLMSLLQKMKSVAEVTSQK